MRLNLSDLFLAPLLLVLRLLDGFLVAIHLSGNVLQTLIDNVSGLHQILSYQNGSYQLKDPRILSQNHNSPTVASLLM